MIEQISAFFTVEMIYMWLNIGVIPFWLMLIIFPQTKVCGLFVTSIIPTFILASVYVYLLYIFFFAGYDFDKNFILYLSCLLYTSPSPRDVEESRMPSSA